VPVVFFSDDTSGCYHTSQDDMEHLDAGKLAREIDLGETVAREVAGSAARPSLVGDTPAASFEDAESMLAVVRRVQADLGRFRADDRARVERFLTALQAIVDDGQTDFGADDADTVLAGTAAFIELFTHLGCNAAPG